MNRTLLIIIILICCKYICSAHAFDDAIMHRKLTEKAIPNSTLDNYLGKFVGYSSGVQVVLNGTDRKGYNQKYTLEKWLQEGSTDEDHPLCRATNHFHNPIHSGDWTQSKMSDSILVPFYSFIVDCGTKYSNVTWATGFTAPNSGYIYRDGQDMGWDYARTFLYQALTSKDSTVREEKFVNTFKSVGMVVHLLQDMAVPAHVRNDMQSHLFNSLTNPSKWGSNPFEKYVVTHSNAISDTPVKPTFAATTRVTDFWDNNAYSGENPSAGTDQGLSEYANANFVSDFTIFKPVSDSNHYFKYPSQATSVNKVHYSIPDPINPGQTITRTYYQKTGDGDTGYRLAGVGFLNRWSFSLAPLKRIPPLDDHVHDDYAKKILPRAVGYSAALLDYFFRGNINLTTAGPTDITFRSIKVTAQDNTPSETMGLGEARLVIRYKALSESPLGGDKYLLGNPSADYTYKVSAPLNVDLTSPQQLTFDFSADTLPYFYDDMTMQLVFRGKLGNEDGAVAVSNLQPIDGVYTDFAVTLPSSGVYAKTSDSSSSATFNELRVTAQTDISGGLSGGEFKLALEYSQATTDPFQSLPVDTDPADAAGYVIRVNEKNGVNSLQPGVPTELVFDLSTASLPAWATDVYVNVIYADAGTSRPMAIGYRDISEPTPVDIFNNTDHVCISNQWYPAGTPEARSAADLAGNQNGFDDDVDTYPHDFTNIYANASSIGDPVSASASSFDFLEPGPVGSPSLQRMGFILTDYSFKYSFLPNWIHTDPMDHWTRTETATLDNGTAVRNQTDPDEIYRYPGMYMMRGKPMWGGAGIVYNTKFPANALCDWAQLPNVP